jgi:hypothetical protein
MRSFFCYCKLVIHLFLGKLVSKGAIERRIVFKSHHIDEPPALGFSFNLIKGLGNGIYRERVLYTVLKVLSNEKIKNILPFPFESY